jgi:hypothetical protein
VQLRGPEHQDPVDLGHRFLALQASAQRVDVADPERGELAEAQTAVGEDEDGEPVGTGCVGECGHLGVGEEPLVAAAVTGQLDPGGGVADDWAVIDGHGEDHVQDPVRVPHAR